MKSPMEKAVVCWFHFLATHNCNMVFLRGTSHFAAALHRTQQTVTENIRTFNSFLDWPFLVG